MERFLKPGGRIIILDKFLADGKKPSVFRKILNIFTGFFFSEINRRFEDLSEFSKLKKKLDISAGFGGLFRHIILH